MDKLIRKSELTLFEQSVIAFLPKHGSGFSTRHIAHNCGGGVGHKRSAWALSALRVMEANGLIRRLDGNKPIIWVKTEAGSHVR